MFKINNDLYKSLTPTEKQVLERIISNPISIVSMNSTELAKEANVSKTMVINLSQKIGFKGFNDLKYYIKHNADKGKIVSDSVDFKSKLQSDIRNTFKISQNKELEDICEKILKADSIYVLGRGPTKHIAAYLTHIMIILGIKCINVADYNHFDIIARKMSIRDLMIAISLSGETKLIVDTAITASSRGREVVSITSFSDNTLAHCADNNIYFMSGETDTKENDTISRVPMMAVVELLGSYLKKKVGKINYTEVD